MRATTKISGRKRPTGICRIVETPLDVAMLERTVAGCANGAIVTFIGQTRDHSDGKRVSWLEYTAYAPMAEKMLVRLAAEARERWQADVAIEHRVGRVDIGEASVVICVGSAHRAEAFEACRWCIDTLKAEVPIWKKEVYADGACWIEGSESVPVA